MVILWGRQAARSAIAGMVQETRRLHPGTRVVLAGFSQGGMLACDAVLLDAVQVDALVLFSSSRIAFDEWQRHGQRLSGIPALVSHGRSDPDLSFEAGCALHDFLASCGARSRFIAFDGAHEIPLPVWREFRKFLREISHASPL